MKLETWIDGNMDIMHAISFCSHVKNSGCYGSKYLKISDNGGAGRGHILLGNSLVVFKAFHNQTPTYIRDLLTPSQNEHYNLRSCEKEDLKLMRLSKTNDCLNFLAHKFIIRLPNLYVKQTFS